MDEIQSIIVILFLLAVNWLQWTDRKKLRQERDIYRAKTQVTHNEIVLFGKRGKA